MNYGACGHQAKLTRITFSLNRKRQVSQELNSWESLELAVEASEYKEANAVITYIKGRK
jgi:hypothetical protein